MKKAIDVVTKRVGQLEVISRVTGDPNTYWRLEEANKILALLFEEEKRSENATPDNS